MWAVGSVLFSLAVSVKMNIFLFAPAMLLLLLLVDGAHFAISNISICAMVQFAVGAPFLYNNFVNYIRCAFGGFGDLKHKWTVNLKFLPEDIFLSRSTTVLLLCCHVSVLIAFVMRKWSNDIERPALLARSAQKFSSSTADISLSHERIVSTMLICNFVGVVFSRSLHFQFYCWYFHALPLLLWRATVVPWQAKLILFGALEFAWSYGLADDTSTVQSSVALQCAHVLILAGIWFSTEAPAEHTEKKKA